MQKTIMQKKTIKYIDDENTRPVTATGVMIYKQTSDYKMKLLIMKNRGVYEDIGGKIDPDDESIYSAAAREVDEETNGMIKKDTLIDRLKMAQYVYVPRSKYVIFLLEANDAEKRLKKGDFGDREIHDNIPRSIEWISRDKLIRPENIKHKMNWRIKSKTLFDKLQSVESNFKFGKKLF